MLGPVAMKVTGKPEVAVAVDAERFRFLFFDAMERLADGAGDKT